MCLPVEMILDASPRWSAGVDDFMRPIEMRLKMQSVRLRVQNHSESEDCRDDPAST